MSESKPFSSEIIKIIKEQFIYNEKTGELFRTLRGETKKVGTKIKGYLVVKVSQRILKVHRICFFIKNRYCPNKIDHINCIKDDNRIINLREANDKQNAQNRSKKNIATSIYKGVTWLKREHKWRASINRNIIIGQFDNEIDAAKAYDAKAKELFREFAKTNFN